MVAAFQARGEIKHNLSYLDGKRCPQLDPYYSGLAGDKRPSYAIKAIQTVKTRMRMQQMDKQQPYNGYGDYEIWSE